MARRAQVFTRLTIAQIEMLDKIGVENDLIIERTQEVNQSEVIRYLLGKADERMIDSSPRERGVVRELDAMGRAIDYPWSALNVRKPRTKATA